MMTAAAMIEHEQELRRLNRAALNYTLLGLSSKVFQAVGNKMELAEKKQMQQKMMALVQQQQQQNTGRSTRPTSASRPPSSGRRASSLGGGATGAIVITSTTPRPGQSTLPARRKSDPVAKGAALRQKWDKQAEEKRKSRKLLAWEVRQSMMIPQE